MIRPQILTFYSFKGGVGRTFALANVAARLAGWGYRVLAVDWDLEAPGLRWYFPEAGDRPGTLDLLLDPGRDWRELATPCALHGQTVANATLDVLPAGHEDAGYRQRVQGLDWPALYDRGITRRLETLRAQWLQDYDFVLLDSRTGHGDVMAVCTAQLPDVIVALSGPDDQGIRGCVETLTWAEELRAELPLDRSLPQVLPLLSRFDLQEQFSEAGDALVRFGRAFEGWYGRWLPEGVSPTKALGRLRIPYSPRWSYGTHLPVLHEDPSDGGTVSSWLTNVAAVLARGLGSAQELLEDRDAAVRAARSSRPTPEATVYLSRAHGRDADFVEVLASHLRTRGLTVEGTAPPAQPGADWMAQAQAALARSDLLVPICSPGPESVWQHLESTWFLTGPTRPVLPLVLPDTRPPAWTAAWASLESRDRSPADLAQGIVDALPAGRAPDHSDPLDAWRAWQREAHGRLIPFFPGATDALMEQVFVRVSLSRAHGPPAEHTLEELLLAPPARPTKLGLATETAPGPPRWLVLGGPGSGKTTLARHLAWSLAGRPEGPVPVLLSLARWSKTDKGPLEAAQAELKGRGYAAAVGLKDALVQARTEGRLVLLFDGLDEVDPQLQERTLNRIRTIVHHRAWALVPIAVLSRKVAVGSEGLGEPFQQAEVQPLGTPQQEQLVARLVPGPEGATAWRVISGRPGLRGLADNPLLLTLMALLAREQRSLPDSRVAVYDRAVALLLKRGHCPEPRGVAAPIDARHLLGPLSVDLHGTGVESWEEEDLRERVRELRLADRTLHARLQETWTSNDALLEDLGRNSGLLGPHDGSTANWRYLHRSLREFLAAEALAKGDPEQVFAEARDRLLQVRAANEDKREQVERRHGLSRWGEVYGLMAGLSQAPRDLLEGLGRVSPDILLRTLPSVEGMREREKLALLLAPRWVQPEHLVQLLGGWEGSLGRTGLVELLWTALGPGLHLPALGAIWGALSELGEAVEPRAFAAPLPDPAWTPALVEVPAGRFRMGSPAGQGDDDEHPRHQVTLSLPARLGRTPATNAELRRLDAGWAGEDRHPAVEVTWWQARAFCAWLGGDLPSEARWEQACRAGTESVYWSGNEEDDLAQVGWYGHNSGSKRRPVAGKPPNPWGLHDAHGLVWEWCLDSWHRPYTEAPVSDPVHREGPDRVVRGGSFHDGANGCRSAYRFGRHPSVRVGVLGFRVFLPSP